MHRKSFSFRINFIHILNYVILNVIVFASLYFVLRSLSVKNRIDFLTEKSHHYNQLIEENFNDIEKSTASFIEMYSSCQDCAPYVKNPSLVFSTSNELIEGIYIVDNLTETRVKEKIKVNENKLIYKEINFKDSCFDLSVQCKWGTYESSGIVKLFYIKKINNDSRIIVFIDNNYIKNLITGLNIKSGIFTTVSDDNFRIITTSGIQAKDSASILESLPDYLRVTLEEKNFSYKIPGNQKFYFHVFHNNKFNFFITIHQTRKGIITDLIKYFILAGIIFILSVILLISLVIASNYNLTKSFNELFKRVKKSSLLELNPFSFESEVALIHKSFDLLENQIKIYEKNIDNMSKSSSGIENDLKIAKKLQNNLLPTLTANLKDRKEFELFAFTESLYEIGGDFYDYFLVDDQNLLVAVADVSGKGIPASLIMIYTHTLLRSISEPGLRASEIISALNNKLIEENISDMFVTVFLGILNINTGDFQYCNAAHNYPLIIHNEGRIEELTDTHGIPVGIYPNRKYTDNTIKLNPGDQLFIYTDGLIDTIDENGLKYTVDVLKYNLMGTWFFNTKEVVEKINKSVINFRGNIKPGDDLTMLNLKYHPRVLK